MKTILKDLLKVGENLLSSKRIERPRNESALILSKILNLDYIEIFLNSKRTISKKEKNSFLKKIFQRLSGKPISKIRGYKEFYSRKFYVNSDVLDPRPESEIIVDLVKDIKFEKKKNLRVLDLGTGSGCLLISIILELKDSFNISGMGIDISYKALDLAKKNISKFNLQKKLEIKHSNWFSKIDEEFDLIISNPPYIDTKAIDSLDDDVRKFDPIISLDGGITGLKSYEDISCQAINFMNKSSYICLELGFNQKETVESIFVEKGFSKYLVKKDLSNFDRAIVFKNEFEKK